MKLLILFRTFFMFLVFSTAATHLSLAVDFNFSHLAPTVSSINFISGVPLIGQGDLDGGFGDVAANVLMAIKLKKMCPDITVNFLVTNLKDIRPRVKSTNEIMHQMIPELDPLIKNVIQNYNGINYIFLKPDAAHLLSSISISSEELEELKKVIPEADLSLQFNANSTPMTIALRLNTRLALSFSEPGNQKDFIIGVDNGHDFLSTHLKIKTGGDGLGYYLFNSEEELLKNDRTLIRQWLRSRGLDPLKDEEHIFFSYSKNMPAEQIYLHALNYVLQTQPWKDKKAILVIKDFDDLSLPHFSSNIRVIKTNSIPHEAVEALIKSSELSPLVTGDVSISIAISTATKNKSFIYESPPWKEGSSKSLLKDMLSLNPTPEELEFTSYYSSAFLTASKIDSTEAQELVLELTEFLSNERVQEAFSTRVLKLREHWSILHNLDAIYTILRTLGLTFHSVSSQYLEIINESIRTTNSLHSPSIWTKVLEYLPRDACDRALTSNKPM